LSRKPSFIPSFSIAIDVFDGFEAIWFEATDGKEVFINPDHVCRVSQSGFTPDVALIWFSDAHPLDVKSSPEDAVANLSK
jgi:hypothetical protein